MIAHQRLGAGKLSLGTGAPLQMKPIKRFFSLACEITRLAYLPVESGKISSGI